MQIKSIHDLQIKFQQMLSGYQRVDSEYSATIGLADGTLYPDPTNKKRIWVRDSNGIPLKVYNQKLPNKFNTRIKIGYTTGQPLLLQVTNIDNSYGHNPPSYNIAPGISDELAFGGSDELAVYGESIVPFLIRGNSGLILTVYPGIFTTSAGAQGELLYQTLDMTSYLPSAGAQMFTVCVKDNGTLIVVSGATETTPELCTIADLPTITDPTYHRMWGVRMFSGQAIIIQNPNIGYTDLYDLRFLAGGSGGGGGTPGGSDTQVQYNKSSVFGGDNNFIYDYINRNWIFNWGGAAVPNISNDDIHLAAEGDSPAYVLWCYYSGLTPTTTTGGRFTIVAARGTKASPTALQDGDSIGGLVWKPFDGVMSGANMSYLRTNAQIVGRAKGNQTSTNHGTALDFYTTAQGTATEPTTPRMSLDENGLDMKTNQIHNGVDPTSPQDFATKNYTDTALAGLAGHYSAKVATNATLPSYTYLSNVITMTATGVVTVDGHALALGEKVLVKNETSGNAPYNGLYDVTTAGAVGVACVLTRDPDMTSSSQFGGNGSIVVESGTAWAETIWICTTDSPTVGVTAIVFTQIFTPVIDSATPNAVGTASAGSRGKASDSGHVHNASGGTPSTQAFGDSASAGSSALAAQSDHKHAMPANPAPVIETQTNDIYRGNAVGSSMFVGNIATLPGGSTLTYSVTSGNANAMVPASTSQLAKMVLYNTTRGTSALISNCVTGTSTITLTTTVPAGWLVNDVITIASQTVSGNSIPWIDLQITSGTTGHTGVWIDFTMLDSGGAAVGQIYLHPFTTYSASKVFSSVSTVSLPQYIEKLYNTITNMITTGWKASGSATATVIIREGAYLP